MSIINAFAIIISGILGLIAGSFINVLTIRFNPEKEEKIGKITSGRSKCQKCQKKLKWFELLPIFSFIFLKRKCSGCGQKISWQYPIVEIITGMIFAGIAWRIISLDFFSFYISSGEWRYFWIWPTILFFLVLAGTLISLSIIDIKHYLLPDRIVFFGLITTVLMDVFFIILKNFSFFGFPQEGINFLGSAESLFGANISLEFNYLLGALIFGGFLLFVYLITKGRAMGFGDVKLGAVLGLIMGWAGSIMSLGLSFIIGAVAATIALLTKKKKIGQYLPFAPFLLAGLLAAIFFGEKIIDLYLNLVF